MNSTPSIGFNLNEGPTLANLRDYQIPSTPAETDCSKLAALIAEYFHVPIAQIKFVDEDRVWAKANIYGETMSYPDKDNSLSFMAIHKGGVTVYEDTQLVPELGGNPFVYGANAIRFMLLHRYKPQKDLILASFL